MTEDPKNTPERPPQIIFPDETKDESEEKNETLSEMIKKIAEIGISRPLLGSFNLPRPTLTERVLGLTPPFIFPQSEGISSLARSIALLQQGSSEQETQKLEDEISKLKADLDSKTRLILQEKANSQEISKKFQDLKATYDDFLLKKSLSHIVARIGERGRQKLFPCKRFQDEFNLDAPRDAFVLAIDIRRSTDLMLKARDPKNYANFIIEVAKKLSEVVFDELGIFDKFTGDGILAFFPEFYSGSDYDLRAIKAAEKCHEVFNDLYKKNRKCFVSVLTEIGLGIGIDYGNVQMVHLAGDFTVVGTPVVYACRMAGAKANHTYLNQPAFEQCFEKYSEFLDFSPTDIDIKNEGKTLAYIVKRNGKDKSLEEPQWVNYEDDKK